MFIIKFCSSCSEPDVARHALDFILIPSVMNDHTYLQKPAAHVYLLWFSMVHLPGFLCHQILSWFQWSLARGHVSSQAFTTPRILSVNRWRHQVWNGAKAGISRALEAMTIHKPRCLCLGAPKSALMWPRSYWSFNLTAVSSLRLCSHPLSAWQINDDAIMLVMSQALNFLSLSSYAIYYVLDIAPWWEMQAGCCVAMVTWSCTPIYYVPI